MLVPLEGDIGKGKWEVEIRFYEKRLFNKNKDILWENIVNGGLEDEKNHNTSINRSVVSKSDGMW